MPAAIPPQLLHVRQRVKQRRLDYIAYDFSRKKNDILKTFFDLAQEFETLDDLYRVCVSVPREFMGVECALYLVGDDGDLRLACDSETDLGGAGRPVPGHVRLAGGPYDEGGSFLVPVVRRQFRDREFAVLNLAAPQLGVFEIRPAARLSESDRFFFTKYTNRIAYNLYNRILDRQHIRHLRFINNLVLDIEHNVIVPNMYFRYLFRQLRKAIGAMDGVRGQMAALAAGENHDPAACQAVVGRVAELHDQLDANLSEIESHHRHLSVFLESLFRRDHFQQGHLVLRARPCKVEQEIILPQLEHYRRRLEARGITVERPTDMGGEEIPLVVDFGLLSQVYANLFSNAVKYTEKVRTTDGRFRKAVTYGREYKADFFGPGKHGVKFNVFTTGRHVDPGERPHLFDNGFRCRRDDNLPGSGHGLAFIRNVVEIHSGTVGYEATEEGNNFFFVLPLPPPVPEEGQP